MVALLALVQALIRQKDYHNIIQRSESVINITNISGFIYNNDEIMHKYYPIIPG